MGKILVNTPDECFVRELRNSLNHLYDPDYLRGCALGPILGITQSFNAPTILQDVLIKAIEALKPDLKTPNKAHAQGIYDLLLFRYIQQFQQNEIANQLGISIRHLRRQQNLAIYELACKLWIQYHLNQLDTSQLPSEDRLSIKSDLSEDSFSLKTELDWLKKVPDHMTTDLSLALDEIREIIQPIADQKEIRLNFPKKVAGLVLAHPVAFQQILLNIITLVIRHTKGKEVTFKIFTTSETTIIDVIGKSSAQDLSSEEEEWLHTIRQLAEMSRCKFEIQLSCAQFKAKVVFEAVKQLVVLVVDDNPELIIMMSRFVSESRYRIIGESNPRVAITTAQQVKPDLVVLDIMMPQVDGLQLLSQIKHHPEIGNLPVVVCSVLPQKFLAESLGASGFLQKPIQREAFLEALNQISSEIGRLSGSLI
jgi:CheY-like chemotaxis protein